MNFGQAIESLKEGKLVARDGWNGKGTHLYLEDMLSYTVKAGVFKGDHRKYQPCIVMFTTQGQHQPGWLASQADLLSEDWVVL